MIWYTLVGAGTRDATARRPRNRWYAPGVRRWPDEHARGRGHRVVRRARPGSALAFTWYDTLGRAGQRDHAATDAGRPGRTGLAVLDGDLAHPGRPGRRAGR